MEQYAVLNEPGVGFFTMLIIGLIAGWIAEKVTSQRPRPVHQSDRRALPAPSSAASLRKCWKCRFSASGARCCGLDRRGYLAAWVWRMIRRR
jgi:hypothetical protein